MKQNHYMSVCLFEEMQVESGGGGGGGGVGECGGGGGGGGGGEGGGIEKRPENKNTPQVDSLTVSCLVNKKHGRLEAQESVVIRHLGERKWTGGKAQGGIVVTVMEDGEGQRWSEQETD
ncbi:hypothetical protein Pmani_020347 [Petrolisthes manimaculis]|uniref:Uncharacterized protein n=1 Tax=Petrolisthes manimaculis TaxID=1843537 RepID=A0AAE1U6N5_9EUCA|nr:hypothetical protein Pmani_020347 [Petrolisthes manimaculis]